VCAKERKRDREKNDRKREREKEREHKSELRFVLLYLVENVNGALRFEA